jgi:hypothetical protein
MKVNLPILTKSTFPNKVISESIDTKTITNENGVEINPIILPNGPNTIGGMQMNGTMLEYHNGTSYTPVSQQLAFPPSYVIYVNNQFTGTSTGTMTYPYKTIQAAINSIPTPTNLTELKKTYKIIIYAGVYDEDLNIPYYCILHLEANGLIVLGNCAGDAQFYNSTNQRNISIHTNATQLAAIAGGLLVSKPEMQFVIGTYGMGFSTHLPIPNDGFIISGGIIYVNDDITPEIVPKELQIFGCRFDGGITSSGSLGDINTNILWSKISGGINCGDMNFNLIFQSVISVAVTNINSIGRINESVLNGITAYETNSTFLPSPIISCSSLSGDYSTNLVATIYIDALTAASSVYTTSGNLTITKAT